MNAGSCAHSIASAGLLAAIVQLKSSYDVKGIILSDSLFASCEALTVQGIPYLVRRFVDPFFRNLRLT